jgi:hypothetical protein
VLPPAAERLWLVSVMPAKDETAGQIQMITENRIIDFFNKL